MRACSDHLSDASLAALLRLCRETGDLIVAHYRTEQPLDVLRKKDDSPVTRADHDAHDHLVAGLASLSEQWPVLSEEQRPPAFAERRRWRRYWLVDPLDGTKEFIEGTGEFTVNIALVEQGIAVLGLVHCPLEGLSYLGVPGRGAWRFRGEAPPEPIAVSTRPPDSGVRVLTSSRHRGDRLEACLEQLHRHFGGLQRIKAGSALKLCRLAEGSGDIYPRFAPCSEWDTAAGQALLEGAGGRLVDLQFRPFRYNQRDTLLNGHFYALGASDVDWEAILNPV